MRRPNKITASETSGAGISAISVSRTSACSITATESISMTQVSVQYMMPGPEHHAHRIQIVGAARHDVARAVAAVEILRKLHQMAKQIVAQIEFDVARDADDDDAHPVLKHAFDERQADQQPGQLQHQARA